MAKCSLSDRHRDTVSYTTCCIIIGVSIWLYVCVCVKDRVTMSLYTCVFKKQDKL